MEKLAFVKCFFCSKNFNKLQLIEINQKTVFINEEEVFYRDLILDVLGYRIIDESKQIYICAECNEKLLSFHFFKRDTKKYSNWQIQLQKLEILAKVESFLEGAESLETLEFTQDENSLKILIDPNRAAAKEEILEETEEVVNFDYNPEVSCQEEVQEEEVIEQTEKPAEDDLIEIASDWIKQEITTREVKIGAKTCFNCFICSISLSSTTSIARHIKELHVSDGNQKLKAMLPSQLKILNETVNESAVEIVNEAGNEVKWKCQDCELDFFNTSEGFKLHCILLHLQKFEEKENPKEETFFVAEEVIEEDFPLRKRKTNTLSILNDEQMNWLRKQVARSESMREHKRIFTCTVCKCVLSTQASLIRHLRDLHLLKTEEKKKSAFKDEVKNSKLTVNEGETVYKCGRCQNDRIYKSEQAFKLHLRMTHIRATKVDTAFIAKCKTTILDNNAFREAWECPDCERIFKQRETLRYHIKSEHPNMNEAFVTSEVTPPDNQSLETINRISEKLEQKELGKSQNFCNECGLKFATAKLHMKPKVHRECHETFKLIASHTKHHKCEECRMIFNSEDSLAQHLDNHDDVQLIPADGLALYGASFYKTPIGDADDAVDEAVWKCGHCPVQYFDANDCVSHLMMLHSSPIVCFIDHRKFDGSTGQSKYIQHMKNKHPELFPNIKYPCGSCHQEFPSIYDKLAHQKVCGNKKIECDYCGKRFLTKSQLQAHMLYELGLTGYSCEFCGKRCKTHSDLKIHLNIHSLNRPYACSLCSKAFKTPAARSTHMESHNFDKLTCEICGQKLSNRTLYRRHIKHQHNQEFRLNQLVKNQCEFCGKSFMRGSLYRRHIKSHDE